MSTHRLDHLNKYVLAHTYPCEPDHRPATGERGNIDVGFFSVGFKDFIPAKFTGLFFDWLDDGVGAFGDKPSAERIAGGPSYIEWGGLIGDQGLALRVMACGQEAGLWEVMTPKSLGITEQAQP